MAANRGAQLDSGIPRNVIRKTYRCKTSSRVISSRTLVRCIRLRRVLWTAGAVRGWVVARSSSTIVVVTLIILYRVVDIGQVLLLHPCPSSFDAHHSEPSK